MREYDTKVEVEGRDWRGLLATRSKVSLHVCQGYYGCCLPVVVAQWLS